MWHGRPHEYCDKSHYVLFSNILHLNAPFVYDRQLLQSLCTFRVTYWARDAGYLLQYVLLGRLELSVQLLYEWAFCIRHQTMIKVIQIANVWWFPLSIIIIHKPNSMIDRLPELKKVRSHHIIVSRRCRRTQFRQRHERRGEFWKPAQPWGCWRIVFLRY